MTDAWQKRHCRPLAWCLWESTGRGNPLVTFPKLMCPKDFVYGVCDLADLSYALGMRESIFEIVGPGTGSSLLLGLGLLGWMGGCACAFAVGWRLRGTAKDEALQMEIHPVTPPGTYRRLF